MITLWVVYFLPPVTIFWFLLDFNSKILLLLSSGKNFSSPSLTPLPIPSHSLYPHHHQVNFSYSRVCLCGVAAVKMLMGRKGYQRMCEKCVFFFSIVILYLTLKNYFSLFYHICAGLTYNRGPQREFKH